MENLENPFSVLKAADFTNEQIKEYWVDFGKNKNSVFNLLNPTSDLPKYLLGSKGTGKTHILKYASFPVQKITHSNDYKKILSEDKYIGLYYELYGYSSSRFKGKGIDSDQWSSIFEYYLDLYLVDKLLRTYEEIFQNLRVDSITTNIIIKEIVNLFSQNDDFNEILTIGELIIKISILRNKIDSEINNVAYTRKFNISEIKSLFTPGDLIFGIPEIISRNIPDFNEIKIIYILDEIEKFEEWQKIYINTLVWDKRKPVTFWLGMRTWGYTIWETKTSEIIREGHEFNKIDLDSFISSNADLYPEFIKNLYSSRLIKYYNKNNIQINFNSIQSSFEEKFEEYDEVKIINHFTELGSKKELEHISNFISKLSKKIIKNNAEEVCKKLIAKEKNPLFQKYKLFKFYKDWNNLKGRNEEKSSFLAIADSINLEFNLFKSGNPSYFDEIVDKRKKDFIAQLCIENKEPNLNIEHSGLLSFIERSQCNPRNFLMMLMKCIEIGNIKNELPLNSNGKISLETQFSSLFDTAEWFYKTIEVKGEEGKKLYDSLQCLSDIFMLYRYCDKPTETSVFGFNVTIESLTSYSFQQLKDLETYCIIIKDENGRKEKNSSRKEIRYNLNRTLCPLWGLPIKKRGVVDFNEELANIIFDFSRRSNFESKYKQLRSKLMAPFNESKKSPQEKLDF